MICLRSVRKRMFLQTLLRHMKESHEGHRCETGLNQFCLCFCEQYQQIFHYASRSYGFHHLCDHSLKNTTCWVTIWLVKVQKHFMNVDASIRKVYFNIETKLNETKFKKRKPTVFPFHKTALSLHHTFTLIATFITTKTSASNSSHIIYDPKSSLSLNFSHCIVWSSIHLSRTTIFGCTKRRKNLECYSAIFFNYKLV